MLLSFGCSLLRLFFCCETDVDEVCFFFTVTALILGLLDFFLEGVSLVLVITALLDSVLGFAIVLTLVLVLTTGSMAASFKADISNGNGRNGLYSRVLPLASSSPYGSSSELGRGVKTIRILSNVRCG